MCGVWGGVVEIRDATLEGMAKGNKVRRVLVYRLGSLGDMLVALPALHLVARAFPGAERCLLTNIPVSTKAAAAAEILDGSGLVQGYMRYAVGTRSVGELAQLWWTIVRWRPEVLVYLGSARGVEAARRDARFFRVCGVRRLIGVPLTEGMQRNYYGAATGGNGLGLKNAIRRLDLLYGTRYRLDLDRTANRFQVTLNIPLS